MLKLVLADASSTVAEHTEWGKLYNRAPHTRDRIMPTVFNLPYYPQYGTVPQGFRQSISIPIIAVDLAYHGPFAIADQVPIERPLPWDRNVT